MKSNIIKTVIALIFLIVFNLLFFLLGGTERTMTEWICYGFIHAAYLCLLATPLLCRGAKKGETVLSGSLYLRALIYFFVELLIGLVFICFFAEEPILWPTIIQSVILAGFIIMQLMSTLANDATRQSLDKQRQERIHIRSLADLLRDTMQTTTDPGTRKKIERCYESISNSSIESFPQAANAEMELENAVNTFCMNAANGAPADQLEADIKKVQTAIFNRNNIIKRIRYE